MSTCTCTRSRRSRCRRHGWILPTIVILFWPIALPAWLMSHF